MYALACFLLCSLNAHLFFHACSKKPRSDIFESMRVEVVGPPEFKVPPSTCGSSQILAQLPLMQNMWRLVLKEGGAKVVERLFTPQEDRVEVRAPPLLLLEQRLPGQLNQLYLLPLRQCVVSPPDPEDYLRVKLKRLARAGVPVVGKQWVVQSLLNQVMVWPGGSTSSYVSSCVRGCGRIWQTQRMADTEDELYHFENY